MTVVHGDREKTPLGDLLESARKRIRPHLSASQAAQRAAMSEARWRQVVTGQKSLGGGQTQPVKPRASTVVAMALAVDVDPAEALDVAGMGAHPDTVTGLVAAVKEELAARASVARSATSHEIVAEVERIGRLPLSAHDRWRIMRAVLATYAELVDEARDHGPASTCGQAQREATADAPVAAASLTFPEGSAPEEASAQ